MNFCGLQKRWRSTQCLFLIMSILQMLLLAQGHSASIVIHQIPIYRWTKTQTFTYKHASPSDSRLLILFIFYQIFHFPPISWTEMFIDLFVVVFSFHDSWQYFQEALFSDWSTHEDAIWYLLNRYWLTNVSSLQSLFSIYIMIITLELEGDKYYIWILYIT